MDRRTFLHGSAALATGVAGAPAIAKPRSANGVIRLGYIGTGRMGRSNMSQHLGDPGGSARSEIVALCDVYEENLAKARDFYDEEVGGNVDTYVDFRRILDRDDIDGVVVSTPDHWHAAQTVMACQAGKDVFVEKPLATSIVEGRRMVDVARETGRVVQVGTMQRSAEHFQRACDIVRSGRLGKVTFVRTWNMGNEAPDGFGAPTSTPPEGLDWDLWLGPAPLRPFDSNRFGVGDRFSTFRYFWDYAGGMLTDWGIHWMDIVAWAMGESVPNAVTCSGGKYCVTDNRDVPDTLQATYEFDDWVLTYSNSATNGHGFHERGGGILFHGTDATLYVDRGRFELIPEFHQEEDEEIESLPRTPALKGRSVSSGNREHHENWLDCMESREQPICDVEIGHLSTNLSHLGNVAYRTSSRVVWDGAAEKCVGNTEADALLGREYRAPWTL